MLKVGYPTYMHGAYHSDNMDVSCPADSFCDKGVTWVVEPNVTLDATLPKKDTIFVPAGGYVVARVVRDNPGIWQLHCHITPHQVQGMTMVIDVSEQFNRSLVPPNWPICGPTPLSSAGNSKASYSMFLPLVLGSVAALFLSSAP